MTQHRSAGSPPAHPRGLLNSAVEECVQQLTSLYQITTADAPDAVHGVHPNPSEVVQVLHVLTDLLLPGRISPGVLAEADFNQFLSERLEKVALLLLPQIEAALPFRWRSEAVMSSGQPHAESDVRVEGEEVLRKFIAQIPNIRRSVVEDTRAAYRGDPAALSFLEVQLAYPGLLAICSHRIAHELHLLEVPIVPRIMSEWAHTETGVDIHPGARIGHGFFIDHCTGVVIGETTKIGNNVKIYQGATLGAKSFPLDDNGLPIKQVQRHPTVEDNVVIYANAVILGGDTVIGAGSTIGGGVFLMESVPPGSVITGKRNRGQ